VQSCSRAILNLIRVPLWRAMRHLIQFVAALTMSLSVAQPRARTAETSPSRQRARQAARAIGLQLQVLYASTSREIDAAFPAFGRERPDALFVSAHSFFINRRVQLAVLAGRERIPAAYFDRESVAAGGLMSYGTNNADIFHHVGVYTGQILKGAKPADLPVVQATKFEFVINLQTARTIGLDVPPQLLAIADEIIE